MAAKVSGLELLFEIFVYGTLRQGQGSEVRHIMDRAVFLGKASVQGVIWDCQGYPGLVLDADAPMIEGEVYRLASGEDLQVLDRYEECSPECPKPAPYRRELVEVFMHKAGVELANVKRRQVWVYLDNLNG